MKQTASHGSPINPNRAWKIGFFAKINSLNEYSSYGISEKSYILEPIGVVQYILYEYLFMTGSAPKYSFTIIGPE